VQKARVRLSTKKAIATPSPGAASCRTLPKASCHHQQKAHKLTPALAAGLADALMSIANFANMVDAEQPMLGKLGRYCYCLRGLGRPRGFC
jgi:hypothetical protein